MYKKYISTIIAIILIIIQIYLVSVQPVNAMVQKTYDDELMILQANSILKGEWLGEYNCLTLIKGPFTPLFVAVSNILKIPFLVAQDIFYILACALLMLVLRKLIKNNAVRVIMFGCLIFNPIIYSSELCRTYRDGIFTALIIYLLAFTFGIYLYRKEKITRILWYYIGLGFTIGSILLCREETVWLLPYLVISVIITIISILIDKQTSQKIIKLLLYLIPVAIIAIMILIVMALNYKYYGVFQLNQYWGQEFKEAYGALTRILPEEKIEKIPVTQDMLKKTYGISEKLEELKEYFDENTSKWAICGNGDGKEIQGGYFHWALMRAVESKGYYADATTANTFYRELAAEINKACDEKKVECLKNKRVSNVIVYDIEDLWKALQKCVETMKYQYTMTDVNVKLERKWRLVDTNREKIARVKEVTLSEVTTNEMYNSQQDKIRINILDGIKNIYAKINPFVFYESIIAGIIFIGIFVIRKSKEVEKVIILLGIVVLYSCRIYIISFTSVNMYASAMNVLYLSATYVIQMIFSLLSNIFLGQEIAKKIRDRKSNRTNRYNNTTKI